MGNLKVAVVAVDGLPHYLISTFDYLIPANLLDKAEKGMRVLVPFGKGNKKRKGIILDKKEESEFANLKPIYSLSDNLPILNDEMIKLVIWLGEKTFSPIYDCVRAILPAGVNLKLKKNYSVNLDKIKELSYDVDLPIKNIINFINTHGNFVEDISLQKEIKSEELKSLDFLIKNGYVTENYDTVKKIGDASVKMVSLGVSKEEATDYIERFSMTHPKHIPIVDFLLESDEISEKELCYMTGATSSIIKTLEKRGIVNTYYEEIFRNPYDDIEEENDNFVLSSAQEEISKGLLNKIKEGYNVSLLYGVTGSGKTLVFLSLIDYVIENGKSIILMVPEISLTAQIINRLYKRYGKKVAIIHSGLSIGERYDEWKRIKNGSAQIVIGTRSAVFAPLENIGLIIIDEEQEHTYKSESTPKFRAADVAKFRSKYHNANLLLSSATPSIESYYFALENKYSLFSLDERFNKKSLPDVIIADMREELRDGNRSVISNPLRNEIEINLQKKEQSILFINRRGHNTFISCRSCGYVAKCPNCGISLTYHSKNNRLMCHYCGFNDKTPIKCPDCDSEHIRFFGAGTQKIEKDLIDLFPDIKILRMDADTTTKKFSHEKMLSDFSKGKYDILLGTQMVTKGLDFENVTLVGVLAADSSLYIDDFRANEKTFSLITQVSGRAGRGNKSGRAVIQTYTTESRVLQLAYSQNYKDFFKEEIALRKALVYPPFCDICELVFLANSNDTAKSASENFKSLLIEKIKFKYNDIPITGIGPSPCSILKTNNIFRYKLLLKCKANKKFRNMINDLINEFIGDKANKNISVIADINPSNIQ